MNLAEANSRLQIAWNEQMYEQCYSIIESMDDINETDAEGNTIIHIIAKNLSKHAGVGHLCARILEQGFKHKAVNHDGDSILHAALRYDNYGVYSSLFMEIYGYENTRFAADFLDMKNNQGETVFHTGAEYGRSMKGILQLVTRENLLMPNANGKSALVIAATHGYKSSIENLLQTYREYINGSDCRLSDLMNDLGKALVAALSHGHTEIVEELKTLADLNLTLLLAIQDRNAEVARQLVEMGADAYSCDEHGKTLIEIARETGDFRLSDALESKVAASPM